MVRNRIKNLAITSLIFGILALFGIDEAIFYILIGIIGINFLIPVPIFAIIALVNGIIANIKIKELGINNDTIKKDKKRAWIGIILGIIIIIGYFGKIYLAFLSGGL